MDMDTSIQMDVDIVGSDEDVDIIDADDVSTYNPANILPETPQVIAQIRKWLQPTAYSIEGGEYRRHLASHAPGTGHWLPSTAQYVKWHDSLEHGLLWIKGIPGSGKSVFAARLAHDLANEGHPVLYFFFRQIIDANHKPFNLLCDWLDQILEYSPPLQKTLKAYVDEKSDTRRALDSVGRNDLWMHLKAALAQTAGRVYLVADALDEMDSGNDEFLRELADLASWKPAKVKVLITSRPVTAVEEPLRRVPALQIRLEEQFVDIDIATFVRTSLEASSISADDQIQIKEAVPGRANGLFLYAKLAMDAFLEPHADIQQVLTALPLDLNAMYTDLLREHSQRSAVPGDLQLLILSWVTHATRPLRLLELAVILKSTCSDANMDMREAKQLVRAACGPLLEIQPDETVSVIHHSLTEFLLGSTRSADAASYPILTPGPTHERLAVSCLHYLSTGCLDGIKLKETEGDNSYIDYGSEGQYKSHSSTKLKHAFLGYAAENWTVHVAKSARTGLNSELLPPILDGFLTPGPTFDAWLEMVWHPLATQGITPMHAAARYGLTQYIEILGARPDTVLDCVDVLRQTPLYHAADRGHHETVKALLAAGADPDPDNYAGLKPLHQAARKNHAAVVAALLASGVDPLTPKTRENPGRRCGNAPTTRGHTPLMYACQAGHLETVESFLPYLKDTEVVGEALRWAIGSRRSGLVKRLIQVPGLDINAKVDLKRLHRNTLFFEACLAGDVESMELLAEAGADTTVLGYGPRNKFARGIAGYCDGDMSALNAFCLGISNLYDDDLSRTKVDLVKRGLVLLIKAGADVNRRDGDMSVPLHRATTSPTLLRLLLEAGADPNVEDTDGSTLLHTPRHDDAGFDINRLLIEEGNADVNKRRTDGKTPLMVYLEGYNTEACIRFLESFSPDCTLTDGDGNGPLHLAIGGRHGIPLNQLEGHRLKLLEKLIAAGARLDQRNKAGALPIHVCQSPEIVAFFVKHGCDIDSQDHGGNTPLAWLILSGSRYADRSPAGIDKFLELGARINTRDHKGRTLLHQVVASSGGYPSHSLPFESNPLDTLRHLVSLGLDVKATDYSGNTLLHTLIDHGHDRSTKTVRARFEMLIASGVDPDAVNYSGRTITHLLRKYSFQKGHHLENSKPTVDLVLASCQNINAPDYTGVCPIHLAASDSEALTSMLIEAGADVSVATHNGLTALHIAAEAKQSNILGMLLAAIATGKYGEKQAIIDAVEHHPCPSGSSIRTALYYACRSGRPESVAFLLDAGAEVAKESVRLLEACSSFETAERDLLRAQRGYNSNRHDSEDHLITTRLDEILEMLVHHGLDTSDLGSIHVACQAAIQSKSDYTAFCLAQKLKKTPGQTNADFWERWSSFRRRSAIQAFEEADAVVLTKNNGFFQTQWLEKLLSAREFELIESIYSGGGKGLDPATLPHNGNSVLHTLTSLGYRGLLSKLAKESNIRNFDDETWRRNQEDNGDPTPGTVSPLVLTACQRVLPNMDVLRFLVEELGASVNAPHMNHGWTQSTSVSGYYIGDSPLHYLSHGKHWWHVHQAMPYLLSQGGDPNARDAEGDTPLHKALDKSHYAAGFFHKEAVRVLLNAGACVNALSNKEVSCLDVASKSGDRDIIQLLINHGASVSAISMFGAVKNEKTDILELLLSVGGDPNAPRHMLDVQGPGNWTWQDRDARYAIRPDSYLLYYTATENARKNGSGKRQELMRTLLAHGADPFLRISKSTNVVDNADNMASTDEPEVQQETFLLHEILRHGGLPWPFLDLPLLDFETRNSQGETLLLASCHNADTINRQRAGVQEDEGTGVKELFIESLIQKGANPTALDNTGRNALHILLQGMPSSHNLVKPRPFQVLVKEMCRVNPSLINQPDPIKAQTPLHLALQATAMRDSGPVKSWEEIIDVLLSAGANTSKVDGAGNTCLHLLAPGLDRDAAHRALFQRFLDMGLDVNAANIKGETPAFQYLGNTEWDRRKKAWKWLVDRGADPAAKDSTGRGLLHVVAENEKDVVLFAKLVEKWGLDPMTVENKRMMSSLDVAAACSNSAVISLFERGEDGGMVDKAMAVAENLRKYKYGDYGRDEGENW